MVTEPIAGHLAASTDRPPRSAALIGLAITTTQVILAWLLSLGCGSPRGYGALHHWDSAWYERIIHEGYHSEPDITKEPGVCGFFPGYPIAGAIVSSLTGLNARYALTLSAQLFCWGFWTYLVLLSRHWGFSRRVQYAVLGVMFLHPVSIFLIAAYSESMFLMSTLGFIYWSSQRSRWAVPLAMLHGVMMTGTRLVGIPILIYPVVQAMLQVPWGQTGWLKQAARQLIRPLTIGAVASLGALSFFVFCYLRFGRWNQYMLAQQIGWGVTAQWDVLYTLRLLRECRILPQEHPLHPNFLSRVFVLLLLGTFLIATIVEVTQIRRPGLGRRIRIPIYLCAFGLLILPAASSVRYVSFLRHSLPIVAVLALGVGHLLTRAGPPRSARAALVSFALPALGLNVFMSMRFLRGWWTG